LAGTIGNLLCDRVYGRPTVLGIAISPDCNLLLGKVVSNGSVQPTH
jgi:hypothetical protein